MYRPSFRKLVYARRARVQSLRIFPDRAGKLGINVSACVCEREVPTVALKISIIIVKYDWRSSFDLLFVSSYTMIRANRNVFRFRSRRCSQLDFVLYSKHFSGNEECSKKILNTAQKTGYEIQIILFRQEFFDFLENSDKRQDKLQ